MITFAFFVVFFGTIGIFVLITVARFFGLKLVKTSKLHLTSFHGANMFLVCGAKGDFANLSSTAPPPFTIKSNQLGKDRKVFLFGKFGFVISHWLLPTALDNKLRLIITRQIASW